MLSTAGHLTGFVVLGQCLEQLVGLADQARSGYDAFLASQAAASPDPLVKDARTRVAAGR